MKRFRCLRCDGCGEIANTDDGEPWTAWASLPPGSDLAVRCGIVRPLLCPDCLGRGDVIRATPPGPGEKGAHPCT